ncbi:MAG: type IV toxin-antitoxin system AbiEi family antitoxin domain-containing protein [Actinobacteria bacterium]|nr:type IV toxin-antitoxin system AbiEi family antitoxin domain-containing protein [Actinomycetota bacterium]
MKSPSALDRLAQKQHSLLTTAQLGSVGLTRHQIERLVRLGHLIPVRPRVYRTLGGEVTRRQAWHAAVLASQADCVLSHACATVLWGLRGFDRLDLDAIDLLTTDVRPKVAGVRAHLTKFLPGHHRTKVDHIPVTSVARTLVDACGLLPFPRYERAIDDALRRQLVTLPGLTRCAHEVPFSGRRKIRPVRLALAERVPGYDPGGSNEELDVLRILKRAGYPLPVQQFRVRLEGRAFELDYAWPDTMHCLEHLGKHWHEQKTDFDDDYRRFRILQRGGWTVWPLTKGKTTPNEICAIAAVASAPSRAA